MKRPGKIVRVLLLTIMGCGLVIQSAQAADIRSCWLSFDGIDEYAVVDLSFTNVAPSTFSISGTISTLDDPDPNYGIATGSAFVTGGKVIGHLAINGTEPGADGLLYVGQVRFEIDLANLVMTTEAIGSEYDRSSGIITPEYETDTLNSMACPT